MYSFIRYRSSILKQEVWLLVTVKNILNIAKKCSAVSARNILSPKRTPSNLFLFFKKLDSFSKSSTI